MLVGLSEVVDYILGFETASGASEKAILRDKKRLCLQCGETGKGERRGSREMRKFAGCTTYLQTWIGLT